MAKMHVLSLTGKDCSPLPASKGYDSLICYSDECVFVWIIIVMVLVVVVFFRVLEMMLPREEEAYDAYNE
jgi:hypothetical protein